MNNPAVIGTVTWDACTRCLCWAADERVCLYNSHREPWAVRVDDENVYCLMYEAIFLPPPAT